MNIKYLNYLFFFVSTFVDGQVDFIQPQFSEVYDGLANAAEWDYRLRDAYTDIRNKGGGNLSDYEYQQIIGNSYFDKKFISGNIYMDNKIISKDVLLRYNAFKDEIEVKKNNGFEVLIRHEDVSCSLGGTKYIFSSFVKKKGGKEHYGYFIALFEGKTFFLLQRKIKIYKGAKVAKTSMTGSFPAKLLDSEHYYLLDKEKKTSYILKGNKKKIIEKLDSQYQSKINNYIKKNKLDLKKKKDLIVLFQYYDSLVENNPK
jgi:hypothetical protein